MPPTSQQGSHSSRPAATPFKAAASIPAPSSDMRHFACKLGYLSRANIQQEARKVEPRLHKLLGHAMLFDNARKYIIQHIVDEYEQYDEVEEVSYDWIEEDDEPTFQYVEDIEMNESVIPDMETADLSLSSPKKDPSSERSGVPRTLELPHASLIEPHEDHEHEWENESSSSTEAGDDDDGHWSDSTCGGESFTSNRDRKIFDAYPMKDSDHKLYQRRPEDDDLVLWAQQPRVLSLRQVEDLFVEAFG